MLQDSFRNQGSMQCFLHKRQRASHLCTDLRCHNNPIMCQLCFDQNNHKNLHGTHQSYIQPIGEAIDRIANVIKCQSSEIDKIYTHTIGSREYDAIIKNMEKGEMLYEEVQNRIKTLKNQVEVQLDLLIKEFEKKILLQKEQFFKNLDNYQKIYIDNYEHLRTQSEQLLEFQKVLKYYSNPNNLYLKITHETKKKSLQWLINKKRVLNNTTRILDNIHYIPETNRILQQLSNMSIDRLPIWMGDQITDEATKQLSGCIKKMIQGWIKIPQLKNIQKNADKYYPYYAQSRI